MAASAAGDAAASVLGQLVAAAPCAPRAPYVVGGHPYYRPLCAGDRRALLLCRVIATPLLHIHVKGSSPSLSVPRQAQQPIASTVAAPSLRAGSDSVAAPVQPDLKTLCAATATSEVAAASACWPHARERWRALLAAAATWINTADYIAMRPGDGGNNAGGQCNEEEGGEDGVCARLLAQCTVGERMRLSEWVSGEVCTNCEVDMERPKSTYFGLFGHDVRSTRNGSPSGGWWQGVVSVARMASLAYSHDVIPTRPARFPSLSAGPPPASRNISRRSFHVHPPLNYPGPAHASLRRRLHHHCPWLGFVGANRCTGWRALRGASRPGTCAAPHRSGRRVARPAGPARGWRTRRKGRGERGLVPERLLEQREQLMEGNTKVGRSVGKRNVVET